MSFLLWTLAVVPACGGNSAVKLGGRVAELTAAATAVGANTTIGPQLTVVLPSGPAVTTFQTDLAVLESTSTGDSDDRAEIGLRFQPVVDRTGGGYANAIYLRVELTTVPGGILAKRFFYECTEVAACATSSSVGSMTAGDWGSSGVVVNQGTFYKASISWLSSTKVVTFTLSSGGTPITSATVDLQQGQGTSAALAPPFDVSRDSYMRSFLTTVVRGGTVGGGGGSIVSRFDNVYLGTDDTPPVLFDDFDAETILDGAKWSVTGTLANIVPAM